VDRFVRSIEGHLEQRPVSARVEPSADQLTVVAGRDGIDIDGATLRREVQHALVTVGAPRVIAVPRTLVPPKLTLAKLRRQYRPFIATGGGRFELHVY